MPERASLSSKHFRIGGDTSALLDAEIEAVKEDFHETSLYSGDGNTDRLERFHPGLNEGDVTLECCLGVENPNFNWVVSVGNYAGEFDLEKTRLGDVKRDFVEDGIGSNLSHKF